MGYLSFCLSVCFILFCIIIFLLVTSWDVFAKCFSMFFLVLSMIEDIVCSPSLDLERILAPTEKISESLLNDILANTYGN